jgi:hypothetical protein
VKTRWKALEHGNRAVGVSSFLVRGTFFASGAAAEGMLAYLPRFAISDVTGRLRPHGRQERLNTHDVHHPREIVGEYVQSSARITIADYGAAGDCCAAEIRPGLCPLGVKTRMPPERSHVSFRRMQTLGQAARDFNARGRYCHGGWSREGDQLSIRYLGVH